LISSAPTPQAGETDFRSSGRHDRRERQPNKPAGKEKKMPLIQVRLIEDVFTPQQKTEMIKKLTDAMVSIEGEALREVTWVTIEEVRSGDWGIGGKAMTTGAVKALAAGKPAA